MENNFRKIIDCAEFLENISVNDIGKCYKEHSSQLTTDIYNLTVTFLGMCKYQFLNKKKNVILFIFFFLFTCFSFDNLLKLN